MLSLRRPNPSPTPCQPQPNAVLGSRSVLVLCLLAGRGDVVERNERRQLAGLVVDDRVPLAEGATLDVLAAQAHVAVLEQQRPERKRLRRGPVDVVPLLDGSVLG